MTNPENMNARPRSGAISIEIDPRSGHIVVRGRWFDGERARHDLGFAKLPHWGQVRAAIAIMADQLVRIQGPTVVAKASSRDTQPERGARTVVARGSSDVSQSGDGLPHPSEWHTWTGPREGGEGGE